MTPDQILARLRALFADDPGFLAELDAREPEVLIAIRSVFGDPAVVLELRRAILREMTRGNDVSRDIAALNRYLDEHPGLDDPFAGQDIDHIRVAGKAALDYANAVAIEGQGLDEETAELVRMYGGALLGRAVAQMEGLGKYVEQEMGRIHHDRFHPGHWSSIRESLLPQGEPPSWSPAAVNEWLNRKTRIAFRIVTEKEWGGWRVALYRPGDKQAIAHDHGKTRREVLQSILLHGSLASVIARKRIADAGWQDPSDEAWHAIQSRAGKARIQASEDRYQREYSEYSKQSAIVQAANRAMVERYLDQSRELHAALTAYGEMKTLRDLKQAVPEGYTVRSWEAGHYSVSGPEWTDPVLKGATRYYSWSGSGSKAAQGLRALAGTVRYMADLDFEDAWNEATKSFGIVRLGLHSEPYVPSRYNPDEVPR